jgi:hypothetical protein
VNFTYRFPHVKKNIFSVLIVTTSGIHVCSAVLCGDVQLVVSVFWIKVDRKCSKCLVSLTAFSKIAMCVICYLPVSDEWDASLSFQDYRANAEKAKRELDGQMRKGRALKVRFAPHSAAVKVKNLTPWVSNELLEKAFAVFGEVSQFCWQFWCYQKTGRSICSYCPQL